MNPLTQIRNTQKISKQEIAAGYSDAQSWHARFKHSAYIYTGGLPFGLTEGDLLAVFSQYGEVIDVNLVRNKESGKSRGFAFLAYEDQRSTNLAVDNLNGTKVGGRIVTVDHVDNYKRKIAEVEGREASESSEEEQAAGTAEDAEASAIAAAVGDGAQIVATNDARIGASGAGPRSTDGGEPGDQPWANQSSVHALLNSDMPVPKTKQAGEEEDPLLLMRKPKKQKKEKEKKKKKDKRDKKEKRSRESSSDASPLPTRRPVAKLDPKQSGHWDRRTGPDQDPDKERRRAQHQQEQRSRGRPEASKGRHTNGTRDGPSERKEDRRRRSDDGYEGHKKR